MSDVVIWGAGAIGGTIGAYLTRAGHGVSYVDVAEDHVRALNSEGLTIEGPIDAFDVPARAHTPHTFEGRHRTILLCTKAHHTRGAAETLEPHLADDGHVVSVQNGLNEEVIAEVVGSHRTVGAFVNFGADYLAPGRIHYGGRGAVVLGELDGSQSDRLMRLHALFRDFEPDAVTTTNIWGYLWGKLGYGAMLFATALTDLGIADALDVPRYRPLFTEIGREALRVADAKGVRPEGFNGFEPAAFAPGASEARAHDCIEAMVAFNRRSAKTHSGIWRDLAVRKRPTEVDAQLGPIFEHGQRLGLPTPVTREIVRMIHEVERGERARSDTNLDELLKHVPNTPT